MMSGVSQMNSSQSNTKRLRLLVTIASFGDKNIGFLKKIIQGYRSMPMDVDVVVLSNAPKDGLGEGVKVLVGLPTKDPWSLPFAHKPVLAENADRYDLFIYTEDDMEVTERNIQAFLNATPHLAPTEIAGFLRYEIDQAGEWSFPDVHGIFRWKPETVERRGAYTIAEFSNEHAAFFILTRNQLKQAIASGGFLRAPCKGRYDMACTAATDPYLNCGFRKVICISTLDDFLIHHMSNRYVGQLGPSLAAFNDQVVALLNIRNNGHRPAALCASESRVLHGNWSKHFYEHPNDDLLNMVPKDAKTVLSIGCGWGATEARLQERGATVTALPLDPVIGATAARRGIEIICGTLSEGLASLAGQKFDCVLVTNLLHLLPDPPAVAEACSRLVREGGTLVMSGPNFNRVPVLARRMAGTGDYRKLKSFEEGGISVCGPGDLSASIKKAGLKVATVRWTGDLPLFSNRSAARPPRFGWLDAQNWVLQARR
jgi:2-polyprenyl-3-methyl-5-hydroxy-6-metoxy-1,4-benzoquinol methylase